MKKYKLIATTAFGLEAVTARELSDLGYEDREVINGRVIFYGDDIDIARANMFLRTADRILIEVGAFKALTFEELFQGVKALPWEEFIPYGSAFPVNGRSIRSTLFSISDCQAITKKAIVERLKSKYSYSGSVLPETGSVYTVEVGLLNDVASLTIDTTGAGLNKRGYRRLAGEAPIKETMAAAMIQLSFWKPGRLLVDPMCGSGTIPIEAAMMELKKAPGMDRGFTYQTWSNFDEKAYDRALEEAKDLFVKPEGKLEIYGSDIDPKAIDLAKLHAQQAGIDEYISFKQMNLRDFYSDKRFGFIITNPPYGERLMEKETANRLYKLLGEVYSRLDNWSCYVISPEKDFERIFGRKADKRRKLYNGRIECQYYQFYSKEKPPKG